MVKVRRSKKRRITMLAYRFFDVASQAKPVQRNPQPKPVQQNRSRRKFRALGFGWSCCIIVTLTGIAIFDQGMRIWAVYAKDGGSGVGKQEDVLGSLLAVAIRSGCSFLLVPLRLILRRTA